MKVSNTIKRAMDVAISRVRFERASLQLPGHDINTNDTAAIREATKLFIETYVVPALESVRDGDMKTLSLNMFQGH